MYQIGSADDLRAFAEKVNGGERDASAVLTDDIVLNEKIEVDENGTVTNGDKLDRWIPIGNSIDNPYEGNFNGDGHTISGLYIDSNANYQGLFGYVSGSGKIEKLSVSGDINGNRYVGGVVGYNNGGTVTGCIFSGSGSVSGNEYVGGVVGQNYRGSVENCYNTGAVTGSSNYVGGIVGDNSGTVENCYNTDSGTVTGTDDCVGGVVGLNGGTVENCHNIGKVSGKISVGGVVGDNSSGSVENCYNTGKVSNGIYVGGVVGYNAVTPLGGISVTNCYNTGKVSNGIYVGGVVGYNAVTPLGGISVTNCYNTGTVTGSGSYVGGVVGWNVSGYGDIPEGIVANCYFLKTDDVNENLPGIGEGSGSATEKDDTAFHSGEVAYLLEQNISDDKKPVWGQTLGGEEDSLPTLVALNPDAAKKVYQLTFDWHYEGAPEGTTTTTNVYTNGSVTIPEINHDRTGYHISDWKDKNGQPVTAETTVGKDAVFIAEWTANTYTITVTAGSGGTVSGSGEYSEGTEVTVTATPATGYHFTGWMENDRQVSTDATYTFKATGDRNLTAKFEKKVTGVTLNTETLELFTGGSATLTATVEPSDAANQNVTWQSDNANVATVEGGTVTAVGAGETTIIVQTQDGNYTATCKVTVTQSTYSISADTTALNFGSAYTGYAQPAAQTVTVENTGNQPVILNQPSSTDNFVVGNLTDTELAAGETATFTVQPKTGLSVGTYSDTITVSDTNNNVTLPITASFTVKSRPSYNPPTVSEETTDAIADAQPGETVTVDLSGGDTTLDKDVFETLAGKDITLAIDLGDDVSWTVKGSDIPEDADFTDIDLNVTMNSDGIPVDVVNSITGERDTVQMTLAHDGDFGFTMTLSAPLGKENAGYWANLYHYDEEAEQLTFETAAEIDADGSVTLPMSHASQYAIVIDDHSHAAVDVSDLFIDIAPDAWYKDAIQYAYDQGLMTGVSATEFAPEQTTTRAMIVSILARLENVTTAEAAGFADVNDEWYATAVNWAANVGVVNGYEDNTFKPNTAITREQLAAILMNYAAYKGEDVSNRADLTSYTDQPSTWAQEAISWSVAEGLLTGVTADTLQPQGAATRAQVAAILQRFLSE